MVSQSRPPSLQERRKSWVGKAKHGGFLKVGVPILGGTHNEDYSILGSILMSPYFGKLPHGNKHSSIANTWRAC